MDGAAGTDPSLLSGEEVVARLGSDATHGLTSPEAAARLAQVGPNELAAEPPVPAWRRLLEQLADPLTGLLLAAIVISLVAWAVEGAGGPPVDALVIAAIVVVNAVLGYVQQTRAEQAVAALGGLTAATVTVVRDGHPRRTPAAEVVPGDIVLLAEGDQVAADARLLHAASLRVAEAALTGESEPVLKDAATLAVPAALADRFDMVFNGTSVAQGSGRAVVTATGMTTEVGRVADLLQATRQPPSPLQREIARVGRALGIAVVGIAVVVTLTVVVVFGVDTVDDLLTALLLGVSLAVAAVPEGLPTILSVVLALGVQRMAAERAIVKRLSSVETLGCTTVACSDKTGTLTTGEMRLGRVVTASGEVELADDGYRSADAPLVAGTPLWQETAAVVGGGSLANDASARRVAGDWVVTGDPTEAAFLLAEARLGTTEQRTARFERVGEIPFTSERRMMSTLHVDAHQGGRVAVVAKGAPEVLLPRCTSLLVGQRVEPFGDAARSRFRTAADVLSGEAYRTLAVAFRLLDAVAPPAEVDESLEHDLVLAGLAGIADPLRPEAGTAVAEAQRAGMRVVLITGDHPRTGARIARDLGIADLPGGAADAVSGVDLERMDDATLRETVAGRSVYARIAPEQKLRIVQALQAEGEVVAMTGDGVNDAPALKAADIGVGMGRAGTEVAKQAADMVLADDNFATIVRAVREGRLIFSNVRKVLRYLLSSNVGEVLTVFLGVLLAVPIGLAGGGGGGLALPLLATQILWVNLLTDSAPALALGVDPEAEDVMARRPRSRRDRVIDARMWRGVVLVGLIVAAVTLLAIDLDLPGGLVEGAATVDTARTAGFTVLVVAQLFNALNARSETVSAFRAPFANRWLWGAIAVSAALQVAVVELPWLNRAFTTTPLTGTQWLQCVALASVVLWAVELRKLVLRRRARGTAGGGARPRVSR